MPIAQDRFREIVLELLSRPRHEKVRTLVSRSLVEGLGAISTEIEFERALPEVHGFTDALRLIAVIPDTPEGLRDKAIVLTLVLTGRRRSEILNLKAGHLSSDGVLFYAYRGKGGKQAKRELPRPAFEAIEGAPAAWTKSLASMKAEESLWPSRHAASEGAGITSGTFYARFRQSA